MSINHNAILYVYGIINIHAYTSRQASNLQLRPRQRNQNRCHRHSRTKSSEWARRTRRSDQSHRHECYEYDWPAKEQIHAPQSRHGMKRWFRQGWRNQNRCHHNRSRTKRPAWTRRTDRNHEKERPNKELKSYMYYVPSQFSEKYGQFRY